MRMVILAIGLVHTVVSISACGAEHPGSIPGLDSILSTFISFFHLCHAHFLMLKIIISVRWQLIHLGLTSFFLKLVRHCLRQAIWDSFTNDTLKESMVDVRHRWTLLDVRPEIMLPPDSTLTPPHQELLNDIRTLSKSNPNPETSLDPMCLIG